MKDNKHQLLDLASKFGLALGLFWSFKYLFYMMSIDSSMMAIVYQTLTFFGLFVSYRICCLYSTKAFDGKITFSQTWRFCVLLYAFAAIIVAPFHYIFYEYIAPQDFLETIFTQLYTLWEDAGADAEMMKRVREVPIFSPIEMSFLGILNNIFNGIFVSIPIAFFVSKKKTGS